MSEENNKGLDYQEAGIPRLIINNAIRVSGLIAERVSRLFTEIFAIGGDEQAIARAIYGRQDITPPTETVGTPMDNPKDA